MSGYSFQQLMTWTHQKIRRLYTNVFQMFNIFLIRFIYDVYVMSRRSNMKRRSDETKIFDLRRKYSRNYHLDTNHI